MAKICWKKVKPKDALLQFYPGIDLDNPNVKTALGYLEKEVLNVFLAKFTYRFEAGKNVTKENYKDALAALYDAELINVKEYVNTAWQWGLVFSGKEKSK